MAALRYTNQKQIRIILRSWWKDKTFVTTHAAESVCKCIRENNCVTVTGNSGVGKTTAVRHAAMVLLQEGYDVVPASTPEDILNFYKPKRKTLFLYDDLCGKYTLNQQYLNEWKLRLEAIKALLENCQCKIMATCRLQVFKDERFQELSIFISCECNLNSKELNLSSEEKSGLINAYCGGHVRDVSDQINSDFFPLLCNLFKTTNSINVTQFFNNPFQFYDKEIEQLLKEDDTGKYKYCCLVLVVIFNNRLEEEFFSGKIDSKDKKILKAVLSECELNKGTSPKSLLKSLNTLEGTFLLNEDGCYGTIHDKLFDYLSHYFGNKMIHVLIDHADSQFICERFIWKTSDQTSDTDLTSDHTTNTEFTINLSDKYIDDYIDRMIKDWTDGEVLRVFTNRNMKSKEFTAKLLNHLNQLDKSKQSELANMTVDNRYNDTTLIQSCFYADVNFTRWIINHGVSVNHCRDDGVSPLYIACYNGHINTVRELMKSGSDLQKCDNNGASPLHAACLNGHIDTVRELIKCGSDLNNCMYDGTSPLYVACYNGHTDTVRELVKCGSDLQKCNNNGASPLYIVCYNGHIDTIRELIKSGSDLQKCTNDGASPLYAACHNGHIDTVRELIKSGSDLQKCTDDGASPLYIACHNGHTDTVRELIKSGSDLQKCTDDGASPLYIACHNGHTDTVRELIKIGSDLQKCTNDGTSPLYIACENGHIDTVRELIKSGSDLQKCDNTGASPLYIACQEGHIDTVRELIKWTVDINKCQHVGESPLFISVVINNREIVDVLLDYDSDVNKCAENKDMYCEAIVKYHTETVDRYMERTRDDLIFKYALPKVKHYIQESLVNNVMDLVVGSSPLHMACFMGHVDIVKLILEKNPNINITKEDGTTPLFLACQFGHTDIVRLMIEKGADDKVCRNDGISPFDIALENGHSDIISLLTGHAKESV